MSMHALSLCGSRLNTTYVKNKRWNLKFDGGFNRATSWKTMK
jgi:hypothetical protein